jgi:hypothetical protein
VHARYRQIDTGQAPTLQPAPISKPVGMNDEQGRVLIPHFYDGIVPLGEKEKQALARAPGNDDKLQQEFSLGHVDGPARIYSIC